MKDLADTICAQSTPAGRSGVAVVRVSGPKTLALAARVFVSGKPGPLPFRRAVLGRIVDPGNGSEIDEAIATCFGAPHSYTGEDMCEFSLHGNPVLVSALLSCLCDLGARLAEPGEFTMRAFLHGRIDLTQAEAIRDVVEATTLFQAQVAARQRSGALRQQIEPARRLLMDVITELETAVEFAEEGVPIQSRESHAGKLTEVCGQLANWIVSYRHGRIIRDGFSMAIVGRPNVGKSSIFNALLSQERAIVAEAPGTTRDLISEFTNIGGIPVRLQDTAGIRNSESHVEKLGIDRSLQAIADADAVLLVIDASRPVSAEDLHIKDQIKESLSPSRCIAVMNKSDLPTRWSSEERRNFSGEWPSKEVSAKTTEGIAELREAILEQILGPGGAHQEGILITNLRHCRAMEEAKDALVHAVHALQEGIPEEFALADLHRGLRKMGEITGETSVEELLGEIFSRFCIGK